MKKTISAQDREKQERVLILAEKVKLLFGFCSDLIPDLDLLKDVSKSASDQVGTIMAATPILGAFGMDHEEAELEARITAKRARALCELVEVLDETEAERMEFRVNQGAKAKGRADLARALGL